MALHEPERRSMTGSSEAEGLPTQSHDETHRVSFWSAAKVSIIDQRMTGVAVGRGRSAAMIAGRLSVRLARQHRQADLPDAEWRMGRHLRRVVGSRCT